LAIGHRLQQITELFQARGSMALGIAFFDEKMNLVHHETLQLRRHAIQKVLGAIFQLNAMPPFRAGAEIEESKMNDELQSGNLFEQVVVLVTLINVVSTQHQRRYVFLEGFQDC